MSPTVKRNLSGSGPSAAPDIAGEVGALRSIGAYNRLSRGKAGDTPCLPPMFFSLRAHNGYYCWGMRWYAFSGSPVTTDFRHSVLVSGLSYLVCLIPGEFAVERDPRSGLLIAVTEDRSKIPLHPCTDIDEARAVWQEICFPDG